ncbi:MAG: CMP/dCMP deaminase zinc-binding protein [Sediminibacterium sp.]|nr:CMP/dCMP deaminase zinc-binding protein [Sediminibacterium sp.]
MDQQQFSFEFEVYDSIDELASQDAALLREAKNTTQIAYAPYSNFQVGAFARLVNGQTVAGSNQENASYPVGLCAERVLLSAASSLYPGVAIDTIAISYHNEHGSSTRPISPCGICRQSLAESEARFQNPIRLILSGQEGKVYIIPKAGMLLPLSFSGEDMK